MATAEIELESGVLTRPTALGMNDATRDATDDVARAVYARMARRAPVQECTRDKSHLQVDLAV